MFLDSICPHCGEISQIEYKGVNHYSVTCQNNHVYEHVVTHQSRTSAIKDENLEKIEEMIVDKLFHRISEKSTICLLIFNNGYEIEGRSTVRDARDFRIVIGKDKAYEQALKKALVVFAPLLNRRKKEEAEAK